MTRVFHGRRNRLAILSVFLVIIMLSMAQSAQAQGINVGDTVPAGTVIENDAFLNGNDVVLDGTVDGDVIAIGRNVTINGVVNGSLVVIGEQVEITGEVDGSVYSAAVRLGLGPLAVVDRSAYFIGARLFTDKEAQVGRDLTGAGLDLEHAASVGRDQKLVFGIGRLLERLGALIDVGTGRPEFRFESSDETRSPAPVVIQDEGQMTLIRSGQPAYAQYVDVVDRQLQDEPRRTRNQSAAVGNWFIDRSVQFVTLLIVGGLAAWIRPSLFVRWSEQARRRPGASAGYGLVSLISGYFGLLILGALVLVIGLGLRYISLRALAFTTMGLGFSTVGLAFWILVLFTLFVSKVIVAYLGGSLILERLFPRATGRKIWPLLLGLVLYVLLSAIPFLGWAIAVIVTFIGLGAVWLTYRDKPVPVLDMGGEEE